MADKELLFAALVWTIGLATGLFVGSAIGQRLGHDDCVRRECACSLGQEPSLAHNWQMDWRQWTCRCVEGE